MEHCFDDLYCRGNKIVCRGWAAPKAAGDTLRVKLIGAPADARIRLVSRPDVSESVYGTNVSGELGFDISFTHAKAGEVSLILSSKEHPDDTMTIELHPDALATAFKRQHDLPHTLKRFLTSSDKSRFWEKEKLSVLDGEDYDYAVWKLSQTPDKKQRQRQQSEPLSDLTVSICVPVYRPDLSYLRAFVDSVLAQTCASWELCLACAPELSEEADAYLRDLPGKNRRIHVTFLPQNLGISGNTNKAIESASGKYIAFADQDDLLAPDTVYEFLRFARLQDADVLYCDEDKIDAETGIYFEPHFKSDYNPELLCCNNYIGHMVMVRRELVELTGKLNPELDGAQDHDFLLRLSEKTDRFFHIAKILYTWRSHRNSTAANPESKSYAFVSGKNAIDEHYMRLHIPATCEPMELPGWYRTEFSLTSRPLVSILIPNRNHAADLERCIQSVRERSVYQDLEFIIIENGSTEPETFDTYTRLQAEDPRIRVITWNEAFNYSAINNFGAEHATGELLLLLNNDTEIISPDAIYSMVGYASIPGVGAVGARLYYPDNTVQHAGVLVGVSDGADHVFLHYPKDEPGYMGRSIVSQDLSAVTGACMLVSKELYLAAGGMDPDFVVAYNDVDFCLKLQSMGHRVVYDAFSEWYHYESSTRGYEESEEQKKRFAGEQERLRDRWKVRMLCDPYYNRNLSLQHGYYNR